MLDETIASAQHNNSESLLALIEKFKPLLKKYAYKLHYEDAYYDLQLDFIQIILTINLDAQKQMLSVKSWVKAGNIGGQTFLWIPYYGYGENPAAIIKNIGYVADSVQIFDYVLLQPHVFFDQSTTSGNFAGIIASMQANKICYRDGVNVVANKTSTTQIGFEMEFSVYTANAESLYNQYVAAFSSYKSYPQAFYWAQYGDNNTFGKINAWY